MNHFFGNILLLCTGGVGQRNAHVWCQFWFGPPLPVATKSTGEGALPPAGMEAVATVSVG